MAEPEPKSQIRWSSLSKAAESGPDHATSVYFSARKVKLFSNSSDARTTRRKDRSRSLCLDGWVLARPAHGWRHCRRASGKL